MVSWNRRVEGHTFLSACPCRHIKLPGIPFSFSQNKAEAADPEAPAHLTVLIWNQASLRWHYPNQVGFVTDEYPAVEGHTFLSACIQAPVCSVVLGIILHFYPNCKGEGGFFWFLFTTFIIQRFCEVRKYCKNCRTERTTGNVFRCTISYKLYQAVPSILLSKQLT